MSTRTRRYLAALAVIAFAMLGLSLFSAPVAADAAMSSAEQQVLDLVNDERAKNGLGPLVATESLDAAAAWLAADLSKIDALDHTDTLGRGLRERLSAFDYPANSTIRENIAAGYATPEAVVKGWINSPGHYENMLAPEAVAAGVALYEVPGSTYRYFWVIDFGSVIDAPLGSSAPVTPAGPVEEPAQVTGSVPSKGVGLMVVEETATPGQLIASVEAGGCQEASVWITANGLFIGYLSGAPSFVNQGFPAQLPAMTPFVVSCG